MSDYDPYDHYWRADDGRVFGSARCGLVPGDDPSYAAWLAPGGVPTRMPTRWPERDAAQTLDALQDVLAPYGLYATLSAYAASVRYQVETGGITVAGAPIATDRESQAMIANALAYVTASGCASLSFKTPNGFVTLAADQLRTMALAVGAHVQRCFEVENGVDAGLAATPPTLTTRAEVLAAFAGLGPTPAAG